MKPPTLLPPTLDPTPIFEMLSRQLRHGTADRRRRSFRCVRALPRWARRRRRGAPATRLGGAARQSSCSPRCARSACCIETDRRSVWNCPSWPANICCPGGPFDVSDYIGLAADSPGVKEMVERLRTNRPAGASSPDTGAAFIYREGIESAMEQEASARRLTLALAGRGPRTSRRCWPSGDLPTSARAARRGRRHRPVQHRLFAALSRNCAPSSGIGPKC